MKITGKWNRKKAEKYLDNTAYPLRLSIINSDGFPTVVSLWYTYKEGHLCCAVQKDSIVAKILTKNNKCGFEIGSNKPPYMGIRGQGSAVLVPDKGEETLSILIDKYLDNNNSELSEWLIRRADNEVAIYIKPKCIYSWDYSHRMN